MSPERPQEPTSTGCALCGVGVSGMAALPCYQLRSCPFSDETPSEEGCPARRTASGCWECDWVAHFDGLPRGAARDEWRQAMLDACPECEIFALHRDVMSATLDRLRRA